MGSNQGVLSKILAAPRERAPIVVGDDQLRVTVETRGRMLSEPDAGLADYGARRLTREFHSDLLHLDKVMRRSVPGSVRHIMRGRLTDEPERHDEAELVIDGQQVMQAWEHPYMEVLAGIAGRTRGDVLEVGFGMGISAGAIQQCEVRSHTIVECHPAVFSRAEVWRRSMPNRDIRLLQGTWQERLPECGQFDAILFDAYPLDEREWDDHYVNDVTYARHFFAAAARHLRPDGVFTYYSNETDTMARGHQRALFTHFSSIEISQVAGLSPPKDCHYWQTDGFVVVQARGPRQP